MPTIPAPALSCRRSSARPLTNGSFTVLTVRERVCSAKVKLTRDSVAGKKVQLLPP